MAARVVTEADLLALQAAADAAVQAGRDFAAIHLRAFTDSHPVPAPVLSTALAVAVARLIWDQQDPVRDAARLAVFTGQVRAMLAELRATARGA